MTDTLLQTRSLTKTLAFGLLLSAADTGAQTPQNSTVGKKEVAAQQIVFSSNTPTLEAVKVWEEILHEVTEITDTARLKTLLPILEKEYREDPNTTTQVRLGILYHEVALNLGFLSKTTYEGYAQKSFELLSRLAQEASLPAGLRPFVLAYQASALSLVAGETRKLRLVGEAFALFAVAVNAYSAVCWAPLFLRGSVAENLPVIFWRKKQLAAEDFSKMIGLYESNSHWAPAKIKSFTYWAWAAQHPSKKNHRQAIAYLHKAIALDPEGTAGKERAQALLEKLKP